MGLVSAIENFAKSAAHVVAAPLKDGEDFLKNIATLHPFKAAESLVKAGKDMMTDLDPAAVALEAGKEDLEQNTSLGGKFKSFTDTVSHPFHALTAAFSAPVEASSAEEAE